MDAAGPSQTAIVTARARACHQSADDPPILVDPVAARILGSASEEDGQGWGVVDRPRRLFFAARARFAEDRIAAAVADGARQVVILGAGLDTFAVRNPHAGLRVFEVDHPATQEWKRQRLAEADIEVPDTVSFVPVDFETDSLADELESVGLSRTDPAVFVWLGVVFYLTLDAFLATLDYVAGQAGPTEVVLDYLQPATTVEDQTHLEQRARRLAAAGEPWFSYFTPADLEAVLRQRGFTDIADQSAAELVDRYGQGVTHFAADTPDALRASRIVRARR